MQRVLGSLALDEMPQGAWQPTAIDMALDEEVLRAAPHGPARIFLVARCAQDQNRGATGGRDNLIEQLDALAVR